MSLQDSFDKVLRGRRSVRRFTGEDVPADAIGKMLEAASLAPSAGNRGDCEFVVVRSEAVKQKMALAARAAWDGILSERRDSGVVDELGSYSGNFDWFAAAPVVIAVACKAPPLFLSDMLGPRAGRTAGGAASAAMAAQNIMLAAEAMGLGSCCLTGPLAAEEELKEMLGFGNRMELVCLVALGHPAEKPEALGRKGIGKTARLIE